MFSSEITLERFIYPIVTCYQDSSLDTLINQVQSSKDGIVAIVNQKGYPVGVVQSHRLWSILAKKYLDVVSDGEFLLKYGELIAPTPVLSSQLTIKELLPHLKLQNAGESGEPAYLVIDPIGNLLGAIDVNKLLKFLLTQTNNQETIITEKPLLVEEDLYRLLDTIPLPIILKSKAGKTLYTNLYCYDHHHCPQGDISLNSGLYGLLPQPVISELVSSKKIDEFQIGNYQPKYSAISHNLSETSSIAKNTLLLENKPNKYLNLPLDFNKSFVLAPNSPLQESWLAISIQSEINIEEQNQEFWHNFDDSNAVQLNYLKNEFLSNLGHDLKSPLTAIIGLSRLLKAEKIGQLNKRQVDYVDLIYRSGKKLMMIINDLIDMSRVAGAKSEINPESLDIEEICTEVYQQVLDKLKFTQEVDNNSFYGQSQAPLDLEINPSLKTIIADEICLGQILNQLLNNSLKRTYNPNQIGIKVDNWINWVAITIWDRGDIIPEAKQNLLLTKPIQLTKIEIDQDLDNNLGLIFAQKLAQVHGGDISFISTANQGNKFTLILPQNSLVTQDMSESLEYSLWEKNSKNANNLLVLIVETSLTTIDDINIKLQELGYYTVFARSLEEVLYKARNLKPVKIIINAELVKTWEQDVIALLNNQNQTQDIPVLVMNSEKSDSESVSLKDKSILPLPLTIDSLVLAFPPVVKKNQQPKKSSHSLTILRLLASAELKEDFSKEDLALDLGFSDRASLPPWADDNLTCQHRIIEADSLEQAHMLARIWKIDAVILDGSKLLNPSDYLLSFKDSEVLFKLPLITLDAKTTEAANQISGLSVFPCLLPTNQKSIDGLLQVIQIATGLDTDN